MANQYPSTNEMIDAPMTDESVDGVSVVLISTFWWIVDDGTRRLPQLLFNLTHNDHMHTYANTTRRAKIIDGIGSQEVQSELDTASEQNVSLGDLTDVLAALNSSEDSAPPLTPLNEKEGINVDKSDLGDFGQDLWAYLAKEKLRWSSQEQSMEVDSLSIGEMTDVVKAIAKPGKGRKYKSKKKEKKRKKAITLLRKGTTSDTGPNSDTEAEAEGGNTMDEEVETTLQVVSKPGHEMAALWQERRVRVHFDSLPAKSIFAVGPSKYITRQKKTPLERSRNVTKKMLLHFKDFADSGVVVDSVVESSGSQVADSQQANSAAKKASNNIHVFIDNSNILVGMLETIRDRDGIDIHEIPRYSRPKLDYHVLFTILERGRQADRKVLVASSPLWQPLRDATNAGYEVAVLERVKKHMNIGLDSTSEDESTSKRRGGKKEQGVDEILHLKILESILDSETPATMVLATGDAAPSEYGEGFFRCAQRALQRGWKVEVISWRRGVSKLWTDKDFKRQWKAQFRVICCLEEFMEELEA